MSLFITGSESFIGRELISRCQIDRVDYIGVDLTSPSNENCYQADICARDIADLIPENEAIVIHLAALSRDGDCRDNAYACFDVNVMGTLNLIDAAEKRGTKQFIFASSEWVYGSVDMDGVVDENSTIDITTLKSEYALSKMVSEINLMQKYHSGFCPITILRFGIVYGQRKNNGSAVESIFNALWRRREITVGALETARRFIHVSDIVRGILASVGLEGFHIINLQGAKLVALREIIETTGRILTIHPDVTENSPAEISIRNISNKKAEKLLNFQPQINLETGLKMLEDYFFKTSSETG